MTITIKYFGLLAEIAQIETEVWTVEATTTVLKLKNELEQKYSQFSSTNYTIAVNQKLVHENTKINAADELALLPPFAGG